MSRSRSGWVARASRLSPRVCRRARGAGRRRSRGGRGRRRRGRPRRRAWRTSREVGDVALEEVVGVRVVVEVDSLRHVDYDQLAVPHQRVVRRQVGVHDPVPRHLAQRLDALVAERRAAPSRVAPRVHEPRRHRSRRRRCTPSAARCRAAARDRARGRRWTTAGSGGPSRWPPTCRRATDMPARLPFAMARFSACSCASCWLGTRRRCGTAGLRVAVALGGQQVEPLAQLALT